MTKLEINKSDISPCESAADPFEEKSLIGVKLDVCEFN